MIFKSDLTNKKMIHLQRLRCFYLIFERLIWIYYKSANESVPYNLFKYALVNCPNLLLNRGTRTALGFSIDASPIGDDEKKPQDPSAKTIVRLLQGIDLDQDWLDLISTHLPNVEFFGCGG